MTFVNLIFLTKSVRRATSLILLIKSTLFRPPKWHKISLNRAEIIYLNKDICKNSHQCMDKTDRSQYLSVTAEISVCGESNGQFVLQTLYDFKLWCVYVHTVKNVSSRMGPMDFEMINNIRFVSIELVSMNFFIIMVASLYT